MGNDKERISEKIEFTLDSIEKSLSKGRKFDKIMEENFLVNLDRKGKQQYNNYKKIFREMKKQIKNITNEQLMIEKAKELIKKEDNGKLKELEKIIGRNFALVMERQLLILKVLKKIGNGEEKLSSIERNLDKYVLSNFYRTLCECSLRLFTDVLLNILNWEKGKAKRKEEGGLLKEIKDNIKSIKKDSLKLNHLRSILGRFDKITNCETRFSKKIEKIFLFEDGKGFCLRNIVAHEKIGFSEIENKEIIEEIKKLNRFNFAFMKIFFFEEIPIKFNEKFLKSNWKKLF